MAKPVKARVISILAWVVMLATIALGLAFFIRAGFFAVLVSSKPKSEHVVPLPKLVKTGLSTITGFDSNGQPYKLTAKSTLQDSENEDIVNMEIITGVLTNTKGKELTAKALKGRYNTLTKQLKMIDQVRLSRKGEYTATMKKATVFLKEKRLYANVPVFVTFDRGTISANGMEIRDNGNHVVFFNRVKAKFKSKSTSDQSKQNRQE